MKLTDIFRRLVSHFIPTRSAPETIEAKQHHQSSRSPASSSSGTVFSKPPTAITVQATKLPTTMPGLTSDNNGAPAGVSKYDEIPGPLGLASASLQGKVALVTGAGTYNCSRSISFPVLHFDLALHARRSPFPLFGRAGTFTPTHVRPAPHARQHCPWDCHWSVRGSVTWVTPRIHDMLQSTTLIMAP